MYIAELAYIEHVNNTFVTQLVLNIEYVYLTVFRFYEVQVLTIM